MKMALQILVFVVLLGTTGCVYSYSRLGIVNTGTYEPNVEDTAKGSLGLDAMCLKTHSTIIYPDDFSFVKRRGDGDVLWVWEEALLRSPTFLIELPFFLFCHDEQILPIAIPDCSLTNGLHRPVLKIGVSDQRRDHGNRNEFSIACQRDLTGKVVKSLSFVEHDDLLRYDVTWTCVGKEGTTKTFLGVYSLLDWFYLTNEDELYVIREFGHQATSFCGFPIGGDGPTPFVWRVDLKTGKKKCVLHWDKNKIRTSEIGVDGDDS